MLLSGFSFIRNGIKFDYPFIEAINSVLPICDEFVIVVGNSDDTTREAILKLDNSKIRIVDTVWDDNLREGGKILAEQTNIALKNIKGFWGFYIQGDEVIHENDLPLILDSVKKYDSDQNIEGFLFNYLHFYGSYQYIGASRDWYRREIRVVRNNIGVQSYKDAQGFRIDNRKLKVKHLNATVFHYGWVKPPKLQQLKQQTFHKFWHPDSWVKEKIGDKDEFDYSKIDALVKFSGTHPKVMQERILNQNWKFEFDISKINLSFKNRILMFIQKHTGYKLFEYKNYKIVS